MATVSALERAWVRGGPERAFTINELDSISLAFGVKLLELLLPPSKEESSRRLPARWVQRLVWADSDSVAARADALAHDARSAELVDRLAQGEKMFRLGIKKAHQNRMQRLAERLRATAAELDKASRART